MPPVLYTVADRVATLTLNRPEKRNALNAEAIELFLQHLAEAEADPAVRVLVVTGAGDRAFCAGADLAGQTAEGASAFARYAALLKQLTAFPKPTVARVNGFCLAGGMGVMLACDLAIACEDAQFGTPEVNVGIWPMMIGALILRSIHRKHAYELVMLGERWTAAEALQRGVINRVVEADQLDAVVQAVAGQLAAKSPTAMRLGKQAFHATADLPFETAVDLLSERLRALLETPDAAEGLRAFLEKRPPNYG